MKAKYPQLEDKEWLYHKYWEEELSTTEIGKEVGCSRTCVSEWMEKLNIKTRSISEARLITPVRYPELLDRDWLYQKYWEEGLTTYEIAEELGCVPAQVWRRMNELNILRRTHSQRVGKHSKYPQLYDVDWLGEQYVENKLSSCKIAGILGCDTSRVLRALASEGIRRRKKASYVGRRKYPELHDKDWLVQNYITEGLTTKDIETALGCSRASVTAALRYFQIPLYPNYKYRKLSDIRFLWQRYVVERKYIHEIATEVGCRYSNVNNSLKRLGIPIRTSKELWKDKDYVKSVFDGLNAKPNKFESRIDRVLQKFIPHEWKYNGGFECGITIGGLVPDFVNVNGRKQLIEGFGDPFHDGTFNNSWKRTEFGRKAIFSQFGYDVLILWQSVIDKMSDEEIAEVVKDFMKGKTKRKKKR